MQFVLWVVLGVLGASFAIWLSRLVKRERTIFGVGLLLLAFWYVGFGIADGRELAVLLPQIFGGLLMLGFGVAGLLGSTLYLSLGWLLHLGWDVLSPLFSDVGYMPGWTIPACLGFDTLVGAYLFLRYRNAYPLASEMSAA